MANYKIIASDLDGTLLDNERNISSENFSAIDELFKKGVFFVPCSGRTFSEMPAKLKNNPSIRYFIHSNGAVVLDTVTGEKITNCISNADVRKIFDLLYSFDTHITFRMDGNCYVDENFQSKQDWEHYNLCQAHCSVIKDYAIFLKDFKQKVYSFDNIEVFAVYFHSPEEKSKCYRLLCDIPTIAAMELDDVNIEIVASTAGKGNALAALAEKLGVDISETIGVGDSENDVTVIKTAGLGLAMANASEKLKKEADGIACSNTEHIVKYLLDNYFM